APAAMSPDAMPSASAAPASPALTAARPAITARTKPAASQPRRVHDAVTRSRMYRRKRPTAIEPTVASPASAAATQGTAVDSNASDGHCGVSGVTALPASAPTPATNSAADAPAAHGGRR